MFENSARLLLLGGIENEVAVDLPAVVTHCGHLVAES